jgi:transposase-like protein
MPWMETSPVDQRERFIHDHRLGLYAMAELCGRYGISRKTGYKWLGRFEEGGRLGLQIAAGRRVAALIALRRTSRRQSVRRAGSIRAGDRPNSSPGSSVDRPRSTGRLSAPLAIFWPGADW